MKTNLLLSARALFCTFWIGNIFDFDQLTEHCNANTGLFKYAVGLGEGRSRSLASMPDSPSPKLLKVENAMS